MPTPLSSEFEPGCQLDDWGDFDTVIKQLETEETGEAVTGDNALSTELDSGKAEAFEGFLGVMFTIAEQATSIISGIDFAFDEKGKTEVIKSALPVLQKHGDSVMSWFGDYIEEATLLIAVLALVYSSKRSISTLKTEKMKQEQAREQQEKARPQAA